MYTSPEAQSTFRKWSVVFLLSRGFATWLNDDETFLAKAIHRLFPQANVEGSLSKIAVECDVHVLAAVVDRIPDPSLAWIRQSSLQQTDDWARILLSRFRAPPQYDRGFEGVAYGVSTIDILCTDVPDQLNELRSNRSVSAKHERTVSFRFLSDVRRLLGGRRLPADVTVVKLPLANTIFQTGQRSTMFSAHWRKPLGAQLWKQEARQHFDHKSVFLPVGKLNQICDMTHRHRRQQNITISMPLIPLTNSREVRASVGNIIREIGQAAEEELSFPASHELEQAVSSYFDERRLPPSTAAVWALVMPKALVLAHQSALKLADQQVSDELQRAVRQKRGREVYNAVPFLLICMGASLHRVLSGGGGWGKKAGLLSLDPDSDYGKDSVEDMSALELDLDGENDDQQLLESIASPGDYVKFYIAPKTFMETGRRYRGDISRKDTRRLSLDFGVIPSTVDDFPTDLPISTADTWRLPKVEIFDRHFGALSEGGMGFSQPALSSGKTVQTKVDVPYTRFSHDQFNYPDRPPPTLSSTISRTRPMPRNRGQAFYSTVAQAAGSDHSKIEKPSNRLYERPYRPGRPRLSSTGQYIFDSPDGKQPQSQSGQLVSVSYHSKRDSLSKHSSRLCQSARFPSHSNCDTFSLHQDQN